MGLLGQVTATGVLANAAATAVVVSAIMGAAIGVMRSVVGAYIDRKLEPLERRLDATDKVVSNWQARAEGRAEALAEIAAAKTTAS
jgi:hypothetical protein